MTGKMTRTCTIDGCDRKHYGRGLCQRHHGQQYTRPTTCSIDGCDKPHKGRSWCETHLRRWRNHGDPLFVKETVKRSCSIDGCDNPRQARGWCNKHFKRWKRHGDPLFVKETVKPSCSIDGCDKPHKARGWCATHYRQLRIPAAPCSVDGCDKTPFGHGYCNAHYSAWRKHGDPLVNMKQRSTCTINDCDDPVVGGGYCNAHYKRNRKHGDPSIVLREHMPIDERVPICTEDGCTAPTAALNLCRNHWYARRASDPVHGPKMRRQARLQEIKRRALTVPSPFSANELDGRLSVFGGRCYICGTDDAGEVEHVKPLSRGGMHSLANLRPACRSCNAHKSAKWPVDTSTAAVRLDPARLP